MKNTKYNKLNNKSPYLFNSLNKIRYSTVPYSNNSIEYSCSERLNSIIK